MPTYRVKAFFVHESELDAARVAEQAATITDTEWTDGYVIGVIDQADVAGLVNKGLVVTPIERIEVAPRSGLRPTRSGLRGALGVAVEMSRGGRAPLETTTSGKTDAQKILSRDGSNPQFYIVRLVGPLTPNWGSVLKQNGIELLERVKTNHYTARLTPADVTTLAAQSFVDEIRLYTEADTLSGQTNRAATRGGSSRRFTRLFDVRTHRSEDLPKVMKWLVGRRRKPVPTHAGFVAGRTGSKWQRSVRAREIAGGRHDRGNIATTPARSNGAANSPARTIRQDEDRI